MAAASWKFLGSVVRVNNLSSLQYAKGCFPKFYSVFAPDFQDPVLERERIKKLLETESREVLLVKRIKPALNSVPCSVFHNPDVERLINYILKKGKRELAKKIVRDTFTRIKHVQLRKFNGEVDEEKKKDIIIDPLEIFSLAIKNVTPLLGSIKIKKSGSWYNVPVGITADNAKRRALKWILECSTVRAANTPFSLRLANQLIAAAQYEGQAVNKKLEFHKMCEANRGYVHYWWT